MKNYNLILFTALLLFGASVFAQSNMEDVIYLKNGSIYRGLIIEQVPNASYKIEIAGGSIIAVSLAEVEKITKEKRFAAPAIDNREYYSGDNYRMNGPDFFYRQRDTSTVPVYLRKRRFFGSVEFRPGYNNIGLRFVRGYKFGQFGFLGLGFGFDAVSFDKKFSTGRGIFNNSNVNDGLYIPLYVQYSGEILKKRITPYYFVEAGYAFHPTNPFVSNPNGNKRYGGLTAAAGFGVKMYSKGRTSFALNLNANWRSNRWQTTVSAVDAGGIPYTFEQKGRTQRFFGAIGLNVGF